MNRLITFGLLLLSMALCADHAKAQTTPLIYSNNGVIFANLTQYDDVVEIYRSYNRIYVIANNRGYRFSTSGISGVIVNGFNGDDFMVVGNGMENYFVSMFGGDGEDFLNAGSAGFCQLSGGAKNDTLFGGDGDDSLFGDGGQDTIYGFNGDDFIHGGSGNDRLFGNNGDDEFFGGPGRDSLFGHQGDDILKPGTGEAESAIMGGDGDDAFFIQVNFYGGWISMAAEDVTFSLFEYDRIYWSLN